MKSAENGKAFEYPFFEEWINELNKNWIPDYDSCKDHIKVERNLKIKTKAKKSGRTLF
jgi:hypothetical protein